MNIFIERGRSPGLIDYVLVVSLVLAIFIGRDESYE